MLNPSFNLQLTNYQVFTVLWHFCSLLYSYLAIYVYLFTENDSYCDISDLWAHAVSLCRNFTFDWDNKWFCPPLTEAAGIKHHHMTH